MELMLCRPAETTELSEGVLTTVPDIRLKPSRAFLQTERFE
jgi:hypothetical protein